MKLAGSIRYGGQLLEATDLDYDDYKRLGLVCPECKSPVFLRKQSEKKGAHFAHFKVSDPSFVKDCTSRISHYSQADLEKKATSARNQRLKLLQRWFWNIFVESMFPNGSTKKLIKESQLLERVKERLPVAEYCEHFRRLINADDARAALDNSIMSIDGASLCSDRVRSLHTKIRGCEANLHKLICGEVIDFLKVRRNLPLLEKVIASSFWVIQFSPFAQERILCGEWIVPLTNAVVAICLVPWAEEFERLDNY